MLTRLDYETIKPIPCAMCLVHNLTIGGDSKRGPGLGGRVRAFLDLANKRTNDTRFNGRKFHACANVCIWTVMLLLWP
jgi:hypothetical protein